MEHPIDLPDVDWASLRHNYGSAADVPALLTQLLRDGDHDFEIGSHFCHQGTVSEATAAVVPFLLEVAFSSAASRAYAIDILAEVVGAKGGALEAQNAVAGHSFRLPGSDHVIQFPPPDADQLARERKWFDVLRHKILEQSPGFVALLADRDPHVRIAALRLVSRGYPLAAGGMPSMQDVAQRPLGSKRIAEMCDHIRESPDRGNPDRG